MEKNVKHFVLVHGACFGAWVWYKLVTLLKSNGHRVTALDLAASGIHPKQVHEVHSILDYSEPLIEFMAALPPDERVILVGHSSGGLSISLAMEKFPQKIAAAVFIAAPMPSPDGNAQYLDPDHHREQADLMDCQLIFGDGKEKPPTSLIFGPKYLANKAFQLCPLELFRGRIAKVDQGELWFCSSCFCITENDKETELEIQKKMIEKNPPDEVKMIHGSDHMAMLSQPQKLSACLHEIAKNYD